MALAKGAQNAQGARIIEGAARHRLPEWKTAVSRAVATRAMASHRMRQGRQLRRHLVARRSGRLAGVNVPIQPVRHHQYCR